MNKWLMLIILIAALIRLPFLGQFPNGFTGDEAQQGYSAYSILKTGKDEWGEVLPLFPRGFGDFKPPLYTYITVPSVAIFGLTVEAVRLPAALVGVLSVIVLYFLTKELFKREDIALLSSLFLSLSPWHIQLSRTAFEGGLGILTFSLGFLFFLKNTGKSLLLAMIFWGLTLYTYHSWRVFMTLFIIGVVILLRNKLKNFKRLPILILAIFILPLVFNLNSILTRSSDVGIVSQNHIKGYFESKLLSPLPPLIDRVLDNKIWFAGGIFLNNYLSYFSPGYYFSDARSDSSYLNFPYFPLLFSIELLFWIVAFYALITKKIEQKYIILWFLLASVPASLAVGGMNANRGMTILPLTAILSAIGLKVFLDKAKTPLKALVLVILLINIGMFLRFYFVILPQRPPFNLRYGYDKVFSKVLEVESQYDNIIISKTVFTEPQIFIAFYGKTEPASFQKASQDWLRYEDAGKLYVDQLESWNMGKYLFESVNWGLKDSLRENSLVVSKAGDFPSSVSSILDVTNPKGEVIYRLVPTNNAN